MTIWGFLIMGAIGWVAGWAVVKLIDPVQVIMTERGFWTMKQEGIRTWNEWRDADGLIHCSLSGRAWHKTGRHLARLQQSTADCDAR